LIFYKHIHSDFFDFLHKNFPFPIDFTDILCYYVKALKRKALLSPKTGVILTAFAPKHREGTVI